jgi:hypothetical protein
MPPEPEIIERIRAMLALAQGKPDAEVLAELRAAADELAALIDETMARAILNGESSIRGAGAGAGLTENAVGPRLARTRTLGGYANDAGRVTAAGVERARYDREKGEPAPEPKLRFTPRRRG